jgi:hypothetical protein
MERLLTAIRSGNSAQTVYAQAELEMAKAKVATAEHKAWLARQELARVADNMTAANESVEAAVNELHKEDAAHSQSRGTTLQISQARMRVEHAKVAQAYAEKAAVQAAVNEARARAKEADARLNGLRGKVLEYETNLNELHGARADADQTKKAKSMQHAAKSALKQAERAEQDAAEIGRSARAIAKRASVEAKVAAVDAHAIENGGLGFSLSNTMYFFQHVAIHMEQNGKATLVLEVLAMRVVAAFFLSVYRLCLNFRTSGDLSKVEMLYLFFVLMGLHIVPLMIVIPSLVTQMLEQHHHGWDGDQTTLFDKAAMAWLMMHYGVYAWSFLQIISILALGGEPNSWRTIFFTPMDELSRVHVRDSVWRPAAPFTLRSTLMWVFSLEKRIPVFSLVIETTEMNPLSDMVLGLASCFKPIAQLLHENALRIWPIMLLVSIAFWLTCLVSGLFGPWVQMALVLDFYTVIGYFFQFNCSVVDEDCAGNYVVLVDQDIGSKEPLKAGTVVEVLKVTNPRRKFGITAEIAHPPSSRITVLDEKGVQMAKVALPGQTPSIEENDPLLEGQPQQQCDKLGDPLVPLLEMCEMGVQAGPPWMEPEPLPEPVAPPVQEVRRNKRSCVIS